MDEETRKFLGKAGVVAAIVVLLLPVILGIASIAWPVIPFAFCTLLPILGIVAVLYGRSKGKGWLTILGGLGCVLSSISFCCVAALIAMVPFGMMANVIIEGIQRMFGTP